MTTLEIPHIPYTNLWRAEQVLLAGLAAAVPLGGTIVELGTNLGGGAMLMHQASKGRRVSIHTVDIDPSPHAIANLNGTGVEILGHPSTKAATMWAERKQPIDLLFIDAGHSLADVVADLNSWAPFLRQGGVIAFHDYDTAERGGAKHFGVQIAVDSVRRRGILADARQTGRIFHGTLASASFSALTPDDLRGTLEDLAKKLRALSSADFSGWRLVGDQRFNNFIRAALGDRAPRASVLPAEIASRGERILTSANPAGMPAALAQAAFPSELRTIDSVELCYLADCALRERLHAVTAVSDSRRSLTSWNETLHFFCLAQGGLPFPANTDELKGLDLAGLDRVVAREQVRMIILSEILSDMLDWKP
jgi:predicted O-methyltransferase YrrM